MNDLDVFMNMLTNAGYKQNQYSDGKYLEPLEFRITNYGDRNVLIREEDRDREVLMDNVTIVELGEGFGYKMFSAEFVFNKDGKFLLHGVWE